MYGKKIFQTLILASIITIISSQLPAGRLMAQEPADKPKATAEEKRLEYKKKLLETPENAYTVYVQGRLMPAEKYPGFDEARAIMDQQVFDPMGYFATSKKWIWEEFHEFSRNKEVSRKMSDSSKSSQSRKTYGYLLYMLNNRPPLKILFEKETGILYCYIDVPIDSELLFRHTMEALDELAKHIEIQVTERTGYWENRDPAILKKCFKPPLTKETPPVMPHARKAPDKYWISIILIIIFAIMLLILVYNIITRHHSAEHTLGPVPVLPPVKEKKLTPLKNPKEEGKPTPEENTPKDNNQPDNKPDIPDKRYTKDLPDSRYHKDYEDPK